MDKTEFTVRPEYLESLTGKIEEFLLAKREGKSPRPLECPVCDEFRAYPGDEFGNLVPSCEPVGCAFTLEDDFSGERHVGEYPWAQTHALHLARELSRFPEDSRGCLLPAKAGNQRRLAALPCCSFVSAYAWPTPPRLPRTRVCGQSAHPPATAARLSRP